MIFTVRLLLQEINSEIVFFLLFFKLKVFTRVGN